SSHPFHADGGHFGYDLLVTQDTRAACPPSHGTLSAMGMESLSAISGMRSDGVKTGPDHGGTDGADQDHPGQKLEGGGVAVGFHG
ncbi:MAG: hypothetical protein J0I00_18940, partial [Burkholderiales bacterium]|nr:hypothetical protein [Burkholderiales bacterium]